MIENLDDIKKFFERISNEDMSLCVFASDGENCIFGACGSGDLTFNMLVLILKSNSEVRAMFESVIDFLRDEDLSRVDNVFDSVHQQVLFN